MTLRSLSLVVLTLVVGTAASVRWYLEADALDRPQAESVVPLLHSQHIPLPLRAEPARGHAVREASTGLSGVALRSHALAPREVELRVELRPGAANDGTSSGTLGPLQVREPR